MRKAASIAVVVAGLVVSFGARAQDSNEWVNATLKPWDELALEAGWAKAMLQANNALGAKTYVLVGLFQFGQVNSGTMARNPTAAQALKDFNDAAEAAYKDHAPGEDPAKGAAAIAAHKDKLAEMAKTMDLPPIGKFDLHANLKSRVAQVLQAEASRADAFKAMGTYAAEAPNARWHLTNFKDTQEILLAMRLIGSSAMAVDAHKALVGKEVLAAAQKAVEDGQAALKGDDLDLATALAADTAEWAPLAGKFGGDAAKLKEASAELTKGIEKRYEERIAENRLPVAGYAAADAAAMTKAVGDLYKKFAPKDKLLKVILVSPSFVEERKIVWSSDGSSVTFVRSLILSRAAVVLDGKDGKVSVRTIMPFKNWAGGAWGPLQVDVRGSYQMLKKNMK